MYLTREEEHIYNGDFGWAAQICMKILVRLGELFNARRLIPIVSSHVSGVSYKTLGDAPMEFLEALANSNVKVNVKATLNPKSLDCKYLCEKLPSELCVKQSRILDCFRKMGFTESFTCTPYYIQKLRKGAHLAWAESSAVVYANSIIGAWTNREGGPSALAAAIIGKTPDYGMHQPENRQPKALVRIKGELRSEVDFGALGILLGEILRDEIPIIQGFQSASRDNLKQFCAAMGATSIANMFYYKNPNFKGQKLERITIYAEEIKRTIDRLSTASREKVDLVFIGCPHCSITEVKKIANLISNKKIKKEFWICTSRYVRERARKYVEKIERSGARVLTDTCAVVTWTDKLGIETIMTNSAKTAYYAPTLNKAETILAPLNECLKTVLS